MQDGDSFTERIGEVNARPGSATELFEGDTVPILIVDRHLRHELAARGIRAAIRGEPMSADVRGVHDGRFIRGENSRCTSTS
jgi:hypothetical protein